MFEGMLTFIYGLYDPRDKKIVYVGKTIVDLKTRLRNHVYKARSGRNTSKLGVWIRSLLLQETRPEVVLIEKTYRSWQSAEREWISRYHPMMNTTDGGNGAHSRKSFPEKYRHLLGTIPDEDIGKMINLSRECVGYHRRKFRIQPYVPERSHNFDHLKGKPPYNKIQFSQKIIDRLGKVHDTVLAREAGCSTTAVWDLRNSLNIPKAHQRHPRGKHHPLSKITETEVRKIRSLRKDRSCKEIGVLYGLHITTISNICCRKTWRHVK